MAKDGNTKVGNLARLATENAQPKPLPASRGFDEVKIGSSPVNTPTPKLNDDQKKALQGGKPSGRTML